MATKKEEQTVEEKLKSLYQLQTLLSKVDQIKLRRGELPVEVSDLDDEIAGLRTRASNHKEHLAKLQDEIDEQNRIITESSALLKRYEAQENDIVSSKQYDNLQKEQEYQQLNIVLAEKRINKFKAEYERELEAIKSTNSLLEDKVVEVEQKRSELDSIIAETKQEEEKLLEKAKKIESKIDDQYPLSAFKRVRKGVRNGLGIVHVDRNACGGCFNRIPAQRQAEIKMRKKVIVCEYCGRIRVDPELAGITTTPEPKK